MSDAAITNICTTILTLGMGVIGFVTLWVKLRYGQNRTDAKLESNARLTTAGTARADAAVEHAREAASCAQEASAGIASKLNGGIDDSISKAVAPLKDELQAQYAKSCAELIDVREKFEVLAAYVHQRNHDILNAITAQAARMDLALLKLESASKEKTS